MKKHEDHICRFNDGECVCTCYGEGYAKGVEAAKDILNKEETLIDVLDALDQLTPKD